MKGFARILSICTGLLILVALCSSSAVANVSISVGVNTGNFSVLANYGDWVSVPSYGQVWHPWAVATWQPMVHGQWVWTPQGWMWASYEPFGWVVYHYGYWDFNPSVGWFWVPGTQWYPVRVNWMYYGGYAAWAPMGPPGRPLPDLWAPTPGPRYWRVVEVKNITVENISNVVIVNPPPRPAKTVVIYKRPPQIQEVEHVTKTHIAPVNYSTETVTSGKTSLKRVAMPKEVAEHVAPHQATVEHEVLIKKPTTEKPPAKTTKEEEEKKKPKPPKD